MFGSSLGDLELRERVGPPDPSFVDEFNVPQEYAVLVFDVRRAMVSLSFQIYCLKMLVEAGLVAFSSVCFEFASEVPEKAQHGSLANLPKKSYLYNVFLVYHILPISPIDVLGYQSSCLRSINTFPSLPDSCLVK